MPPGDREAATSALGACAAALHALGANSTSMRRRAYFGGKNKEGSRRSSRSGGTASKNQRGAPWVLFQAQVILHRSGEPSPFENDNEKIWRYSTYMPRRGSTVNRAMF